MFSAYCSRLWWTDHTIDAVVSKLKKLCVCEQDIHLSTGHLMDEIAFHNTLTLPLLYPSLPSHRPVQAQRVHSVWSFQDRPTKCTRTGEPDSDWFVMSTMTQTCANILQFVTPSDGRSFWHDTFATPRKWAAAITSVAYAGIWENSSLPQG